MSATHRRTLSRRRMLAVLAASAAAARVPSAFAGTAATRWRGFAFGAEASLAIRDPDRARAKTAIADCVAEIGRIEKIFSLFRRDSALVALNTAGHLADPPPALVDVLSFAKRISAMSDGAFDVTVQPLWRAYVYGQRHPRERAAARERARALVDWRQLSVSPDRLAFAAPGMAATLNGIAQGFATDRIAERLRRHGFPHVLVNLGEFRALGHRAEAEPWRIGVARPDDGGLAAVLALSDRAVATSSPLAATLDAGGSDHHLFDPRTGRSARSWGSVTVIAPTALCADALSTAIAVAPEAAAQAILTRGGGEEAILIDGDGQPVRLRA